MVLSKRELFVKKDCVSQFMSQSFLLAKKGLGKVLPNPAVGAVLVRRGTIIGQGWHTHYGGIHAEENAIQDCLNQGRNPSGAELYVTLEPCCFSSKKKHNPPCTSLILKHGIKKVFIGRLDPNPLVRGDGVRLLKKEGISVEYGFQEESLARLNSIYETIQVYKRPYIHLKAAITMDGFIAASDGTSKWISSPPSRKKVMSLRRSCDAILVGRGTAETDRPSLTVRSSNGTLKRGSQPLRILLSSKGIIPTGWPPKGTDLLLCQKQSKQPAMPTSIENSKVIPVEVRTDRQGKLSLKDLGKKLLAHRIYSVLTEGGSGIFSSFLKEGFWDRLTIFQSPDILGNGIPFYHNPNLKTLKDQLTLHNIIKRTIGRDSMIEGDREAFRVYRID